MIYPGITGSTISYNVTYSNSASGRICGSNNIVDATSCIDGICCDEFNISSSLCQSSADINVTVIAITNVGEAPKLNPVKEGQK